MGCDIEDFDDLIETGQGNYERYEESTQSSDSQSGSKDSSSSDDKSSSSLSVPSSSSSLPSSTSCGSLSAQKNGSSDSGQGNEQQYSHFEQILDASP